MFISSNLTFCIPFNSIFIYYNNLIFSIFSFGTGLLGLYVRAESQIYLIGYPDYFPFSYKLRLLLLILSFLVYKINLKYIERYQKPNVLEISIPYNFYILSSLFAISSNNFISFYLSLELQSLSLISLIFVITFVLPALVNTSGEQTASPTVIEAAFKNF